MCFLNTGCNDKNEDPAPTDNVPTGKLFFHLHTYIDETEVDLYNIAYTTIAGRAFSLSLAQLYISEVEVEKFDGTLLPVQGPVVFKVLNTETYFTGDLPVGNYKSIRFKVGLKPSVNSLSPSQSSDSTALNRPEMWFGSTAQPDSYVFMNVEGSLDTTTAMTGQMAPFRYRIGTNAHYKQVIMPDQSFTIVENQVEYAHLLIDYSRLFNGIQINQISNLNVTSPADNSSGLATVIANNIPLMFRFEM